MTVTFGVHTGLQNTSVDELRRLWTRIEELGFGWISIWDHFYSADFQGYACHEAVASHAALACHTSRVRCGSLVYCAGYRHPAVLANAIATIDHLSGGRADMGLGAGWAFNEYAAYGMPFPSTKERLDILEESVQCVRLLLREEEGDFHGTHFTLDAAHCEPKPIQAELPIWIGGGGEKRTLKIVARWADGWNVPFISPEEFARKRNVLADHCATANRDVTDVKCAVNVGLAFSEESLKTQFGQIADFVRPGVLTGTDEQIIDTVGRFIEAGADQINIAMRAPWLSEELDRLAPLLPALTMEVRTDPLTGAVVAVAASRQSRPNQPVDDCPFCIGGVEAPDPYDVKAFPNRWPSFPDGRCEVVLYAPEHDATFWSIGVGRATKVVDLWAARSSALGGRDDIAYVLVFENRGAAVGATIPHPHGQIYAYDAVPPAPANELGRAARDGCPLCAEAPGDRLVYEGDGWRAWVPRASMYPYGLVVAPVAHEPDLPSLSAGARHTLATALVDVLHRLDALWGEPMPYMLWWHQRPFDGSEWPDAHVHAEIAVPLRAPGVQRYVAAGELGSGLFVNPVVPETAAQELREVVW